MQQRVSKAEPTQWCDGALTKHVAHIAQLGSIAGSLEAQVLHEAGGPFIDSQLSPVCRCDRVAEPLMRHLRDAYL